MAQDTTIVLTAKKTQNIVFLILIIIVLLGTIFTWMYFFSARHEELTHDPTILRDTISSVTLRQKWLLIACFVTATLTGLVYIFLNDVFHKIFVNSTQIRELKFLRSPKIYSWKQITEIHIQDTKTSYGPKIKIQFSDNYILKLTFGAYFHDKSTLNQLLEIAKDKNISINMPFPV